MRHFFVCPYVYFILIWEVACALRLDAQNPSRRSGRSTRNLLAARGLATRASVQLNNSGDLGYYVDVSLGGQRFNMLVDTGSSDLWIAGSVTNSTDTGRRADVAYAIGGVEGPVKTALFEFSGYTIPNQVFLEIPPNNNFTKGTGILGLGPNSGSFIFQELQSTSALSVMDRVFLQNAGASNYFTVLLGRDNDMSEFFSGSITIGEVMKNYSAVMDEPKLPMTIVPDDQANDQHLQVLLDNDGILGPDGKSIPVRTSVKYSSTEQATVILDCGFSFPQVPRSVADAIYSRFYGAEYITLDKVGSTWIVPCDQEVNVTFLFSGKQYPAHPLDMTTKPYVVGLDSIKNSKGEDCCIGTFQPFTYDRDVVNYDMILGMSFMRNVYALFNYGDFVTGSDTEQQDPYVQLLSITDAAQAHSDFVNVRLGGIDTTGSKGLMNNAQSTIGLKYKAVYYTIGAVAIVVVLIATI